MERHILPPHSRPLPAKPPLRFKHRLILAVGDILAAALCTQPNAPPTLSPPAPGKPPPRRRRPAIGWLDSSGTIRYSRNVSFRSARRYCTLFQSPNVSTSVPSGTAQHLVSLRRNPLKQLDRLCPSGRHLFPMRSQVTRRYLSRLNYLLDRETLPPLQL